MFAQGIILIVVVTVFIYLFWKMFLKDWLVDLGIIDPEPKKTLYTERLDKTREEYKDTKTSAEAIRTESKLTGGIKDMEKVIDRTDKKIDHDRE